MDEEKKVKNETISAAAKRDRVGFERSFKAMLESNLRKVIQVVAQNTLKLETAYEKDMDMNKPFKVYGVKGVKSKPFVKRFKNEKHYDAWFDKEKDDVEISHMHNEDKDPGHYLVDRETGKTHAGPFKWGHEARDELNDYDDESRGILTVKHFDGQNWSRSEISRPSKFGRDSNDWIKENQK